MLKTNKPQYDFFTNEVFNKLLPKEEQKVSGTNWEVSHYVIVKSK